MRLCPRIPLVWWHPANGLRSPAHVYTYSFEPNPAWSSFYAYAPEIRKYFDDFAARHELARYVSLNSKVLSAVWHEDVGQYEIEVIIDGKITKDRCDVLINGTGFLNSWKWPQIEGLHSFAGSLLHSAYYDVSVDLKDKRVAVIGTGSSAIQIVPQVQKVAKHLTTFMRSSTWISPPVSGNILQEQIQHSSENQDGKTSPDSTGQYYFTEEEKRNFRENPDKFLQYRRRLESTFNGLFDIFIADTDASIGAQKAMREEMIRRLGPGHEDLKSKMIPSWPPGCKRITPGDGYLEALIQPNVTIVHKEISRIVPKGLIDSDGQLHEVDILICATGFNIAFAPPFTVKGTDGVDMKTAFGLEPKVYLAVTVPKFPNYFIVNGPRGNWAAGSALCSHEVQVEYILECVRRIQREDIHALEVREEPIDQLYEYIDTWHKTSVWSKDCKRYVFPAFRLCDLPYRAADFSNSWFKTKTDEGSRLWVWAGSALHYMKTLKEIRWEHYEFRYRTANLWSFLGNGRVEAEIARDPKRLAPYIRNEDVPWNID